MQAERAHFSRAVILAAGFAAGALTRALVNTGQAREVASLRRSIADLETNLAAREAEWEQTAVRLSERLDAHDARFNDLPSTSQIVAAMDELLSKTMQSLNQRLSTQADSIELLKTTVAQTDGLLERVLESLDALRPAAEGHAETGPGGK